jgi:hypothetical protein
MRPDPQVSSVTGNSQHDDHVPSFCVRYRSRGQVREVRWTDGELSAEPLVEVLVHLLVRSDHPIRPTPDGLTRTASLDDPEPAALTVLEALYEVGAHIMDWQGDVDGLGRS